MRLQSCILRSELLRAGLTAVNMIWFWYVAMHYRYKDVKHAQKRYVGGTSLKPPRGPVPPWARAREVGIPISHRRPVSCPPCPECYVLAMRQVTGWGLAGEPVLEQCSWQSCMRSVSERKRWLPARGHVG